MYDPLTSRYAFACPVQGEAHVLLSAFRSIEQLPGAAHPAVYRIAYDCPCGDRHVGLQPLACEDGEHTTAADHEVGRLVAAGHRQSA